MTTVFTSNGETITSEINANKSTSGLSSHEKVIVGCVVGIITPVVIGLVVFALWWYRKRNTGVDHSGQEWDDGADDDQPEFDNNDETLARSDNVNKAVNF